jgi:hypothetical protein
MNRPPFAVLVELTSCVHPSADYVIGLSNDWLWCTRCGAVQRVGSGRWTLTALVAEAKRAVQ